MILSSSGACFGRSSALFCFRRVGRRKSYADRNVI